MSKICYTICSNLDKAADALGKTMGYLTRNKLLYYSILGVVMVASMIKSWNAGGWFWTAVILSMAATTSIILCLSWWAGSKVVQYCLIKHAPNDQP